MKKNFLYIAGLALLVSACQSDETLVEEVVSSADDANFTISLSAPEALTATRAAAEGTNSAKGGITNVDMDEYDLRYQLMVYRITDDGTYTLAISPQVQVVDEYQTVTYSLRLTPNRNYQFIAWADFVKEGETADLHYDTSTYDSDGWTITCLDDADEQLNDESRDAYYVSESLSVTTDYSASLELKRPFAKVRIVATDWGYESLEMPDNISITYYGCKRFNNINLLDGTSESDSLGVASSATTYTVEIDKDNKDYAEGYDGEDYEITNGTGSKYSYRTLTVDYLMTDVSEQTSIHLDFEAYDGTTYINGYDFLTDIPIKRNYLTTIMGNLLTTATDINVWINEDFEDEYTWPDGYVSSAEELELALALGVETITLTADIDMGGEALDVYETTETINLNGYTLSSVAYLAYYTDDSYEGTDESGSTLTINGGEDADDTTNQGTIEDSTYGIYLWGTGAGLTLNNVEVDSYYTAVYMGMGFDDTGEVNESQTLTVNNSVLTTSYKSTPTVYIISHRDVNITMTDSEIINTAGGHGISNGYYQVFPEGCSITLVNTDITVNSTTGSGTGSCVYLCTGYGGEKSSLNVTGGTFTSGYYDNFRIGGADITVSGATIINTDVHNSVTSELRGHGILLAPAPYVTTSKFNWNNYLTPYDIEVDLKDVTYKLASDGTCSWYVCYAKGIVDYTTVLLDDGTYGDDGHTEDSTYNYVESTE